jgi:hypothetical protein
MLLALIYALIVVVIGAICFYLIDKVCARRATWKSAQNSRGFVLPCRDSATATADTRRELLTEQLRQPRDIHRNPARLLFREQLGCRAAARQHFIISWTSECSFCR